MERRAPSESPFVAWYREFEPHPALRSRVRALFSFTWCIEPNPSRRLSMDMAFGAADAFSAPSFADASASIVFDLGAILRSNGSWHDDSASLGGHVIGPLPCVSPVTTAFRGELPAMVGAYLRPGQLSAFAHVSSPEASGLTIPIDDLWCSAESLGEQLSTLGERARLDLLERVLLRRMSEPRERSSSVDVRGLTTCVSRADGSVSVESLAHWAGVSRQQLTRVFRERVGVSPKLYCRLARFRSLVPRVFGDADHARVACEAGYADQSHMIAEFREFSGLTPQMLATRRWFHPFTVARRALDSWSPPG